LIHHIFIVCLDFVIYGSDSLNCMRYISYWGGRNDIAFVGDSRIRQLYFEFTSLLSKDDVVQHKAHSALQFTDPKSHLQVVCVI